ncbi:hypothetical protein [Xanthomonas sp. MWU16-30325]|uniref:terminase small subunit-like protein n=1 Tax=Xanthomonas sp. MWU16-30325 TaxID=2878096 RepID=UPI001CF8808F|nr:hypothetical protein [Xanthomonas sp. MWU16-30325]
MTTAKAAKTIRKPGRPPKKSAELIAKIGFRLGQGEPLAAICRDVGLYDGTVRDWMEKDQAVFHAIARAREEGEQAIAHRLRATARGKRPKQGGDSTGDVQRDKLIIETDLKLLAKWNPKRYGDKVQQELSGPDGAPLAGPTIITLVAGNGGGSTD